MFKKIVEKRTPERLFTLASDDVILVAESKHPACLGRERR